MATGSSAAVKKEALEKQKATCAARLIPRLAAHLFGTGVYDKQRVRHLLQKGGYKGPGWKDEGRAVQILAEAGYDMFKFERTQAERKPAKHFAMARVHTSTEAPVEVTVMDSATDKLKNVTIILMQAEREILREFKSGKRKTLGGLSVTVGAALDEIRR